MQGPETRSSNSVSVGHEIDFIFKLNLSCSGVKVASEVKPVATHTSSYCRYDIVPYHGLCLPRGRRGSAQEPELPGVKVASEPGRASRLGGADAGASSTAALPPWEAD